MSDEERDEHEEEEREKGEREEDEQGQRENDDAPDDEQGYDDGGEEPWPWHNKAGRSDYCPPAFYYWDDQLADCPRLVAWSPDCRQMRAALLALLDGFSASADILLKRRSTGPGPDDPYIRWHGEQTLDAVRQALDEFAPYVFKGGNDVLCLMNVETREYLALDEYGILWFYTTAQEYGGVLEGLDFEPRRTPMVTEGGCYVARLPEQDEMREGFVARLGLERD